MVAMFLLGGVANAGYIDFTSATFDGANNQPTFTANNVIGSIGVTLASDPNPFLTVVTKSASGLGINTLLPAVADENNEIDDFAIDSRDELLKITFSAPVLIDSFSISRLFNNDVLWYDEVGKYSLDGTNYISFFSTNSGNTDIAFARSGAILYTSRLRMI